MKNDTLKALALAAFGSLARPVTTRRPAHAFDFVPLMHHTPPMGGAAEIRAVGVTQDYLPGAKEENLTAIRLRMMRARTVMHIALDPQWPNAKGKLESPCGRFVVIGDEEAILDAFEHWQADVEKVLRHTLPGFYALESTDLDKSECRGFMPLPTGTIAWNRHPGWVLLLRRIGDNTMSSDIAALIQWLDKSRAWLDQNPAKAVDIAQRLGYTDAPAAPPHDEEHCTT